PSHGAVSTEGVVPLAPSFDTVGWLARDARMLRRCGRVLLGDDEAGDVDGAGFGAVALLDDAFEMVDARYAGALRDAAARAARAFTRVIHARLGPRGLAPWLEVFSALKQWEAWHAHGTWIRATAPRFAPDIRRN